MERPCSYSPEHRLPPNSPAAPDLKRARQPADVVIPVGTHRALPASLVLLIQPPTPLEVGLLVLMRRNQPTPRRIRMADSSWKPPRAGLPKLNSAGLPPIRRRPMR